MRSRYPTGIAMELRHLRYFLAVAEHGPLTRAAERLGIQQPPLSRAIKNLETEVGESLFFRTPRGVELTEAGTAFYSGASSILKDLERIVELTRSTARGEQGRIRVGLTPTGAFVPFVPECVAAFRGLYSAVSLTIEETLSGQFIEGLQSGKIDAAFMWTPHAEGLLKIPVFEDVLLVALPRADVACKVNTASRTCKFALDKFIIPMYPSFEQFANFCCKLLNQQILKTPFRRRETSNPIYVQLPKAIGITKQGQQWCVRDFRVNSDGESAEQKTSDK
jgi:hypothetical protein